jgi:hypothetical protein
MGNQILGLAAGLETFRMAFGSMFLSLARSRPCPVLILWLFRRPWPQPASVGSGGRRQHSQGAGHDYQPEPPCAELARVPCHCGMDILTHRAVVPEYAIKLVDPFPEGWEPFFLNCNGMFGPRNAACVLV